ncbi:hypothetical protein AX17_003931 [Amanita inopinata Kibby_2008]|nr:hypothetical protein AX17_003931 [Amanita inopinata Kibby_2008]
MYSFSCLLTIACFVNAVAGSTLPVAPRSQQGAHSAYSKRDGGTNLEKRTTSFDYTQVFRGTGTGPTDRDAAIEGSGYITYTVVPNSTYDVGTCYDYCSSVPGCVFLNIYYEFNNELLDFEFPEHSNLKCAVYSEVHTAEEKTNTGGQQSYPAPAPLTYIQQSAGYALLVVDPPTPTGYKLVFGPTNGANNAPGYMGYRYLDTYSTDTCATYCNTREPDPVGGACQYFNIWHAVVDGTSSTYTCAMYYLPTDESTAVNYGQGDLQVIYSRGYVRT